MRELLFTALCLFALNCSANDWSVHGKNLYYEGIRIASKLNISRQDIEGQEGGALFDVVSNKHDSFRALQIISGSGSEIWILNRLKKTAFLADKSPTDMNLKWVDDRQLMASRASMGASVSVIYTVDDTGTKISTSPSLGEMIYFSPNSNFVASLELNLGSDKGMDILFEKNYDQDRSRVPVVLDYDYVEDVLGDISNVWMKSCVLHFSYKMSEKAPAVKMQIDIPEKSCPE